MIERWFAELTTKWLQAGHPPIHQGILEAANQRRGSKHWNEDPKPFRLAQDRRRDPRNPRRLLCGGFRLRSRAARCDLKKRWQRQVG